MDPPVSQANLEIVVAQFELANARDFAGAMDAWADEITLVIHGLGLFTEHSASGKEAVGAWFGDWFRQFGSDYRFDIEETHAAADRVFVLATHHGRGRHSRAPVEQRTAYVYTLRGDKLTRLEVCGGDDARDRALDAAGLGE